MLQRNYKCLSIPGNRRRLSNILQHVVSSPDSPSYRALFPQRSVALSITFVNIRRERKTQTPRWDIEPRMLYHSSIDIKAPLHTQFPVYFFIVFLFYDLCQHQYCGSKKRSGFTKNSFTLWLPLEIYQYFQNLKIVWQYW